MNKKILKQLKSLVLLFTGAIIGVAVMKTSFSLAATGAITGLLFFTLVASKNKNRTDERELVIQEKAARMTYGVFAPTIGLTAFLLLLPSKSGLSVFSKGDWLYLESIGMIFAYLTLFLFLIYAILYHFLNNKFGGNNE